MKIDLAEAVVALTEKLSALEKAKQESWWSKYGSLLGYLTSLVVLVGGSFMVNQQRIQSLEHEVRVLRRDAERFENSDGHPKVTAAISSIRSQLEVVSNSTQRNSALEPKVNEILTKVRVIEEQIRLGGSSRRPAKHPGDE